MKNKGEISMLNPELVYAFMTWEPREIIDENIPLHLTVNPFTVKFSFLSKKINVQNIYL